MKLPVLQAYFRVVVSGLEGARMGHVDGQLIQCPATSVLVVVIQFGRARLL